MQTFRSSGKLLLSGEYTVLQGAQAVAVPTMLGQSLRFQARPAQAELHWQAKDHRGGVWLEARFDAALNLLEKKGPVDLLQKLLNHCFENGLPKAFYGQVLTQLEFPQAWGLGSSSSFTHLIAQWTGKPLMPLYRSAFQGSAYDVFCAEAQAPILYRLQEEHAHFHPVNLPACFAETYLVYLGQKKDSQHAVLDFQNKAIRAAALQEIDRLSGALLQLKSPSALQEWMQTHEKLTGSLLQQAPIGESRFRDFAGTVKSLGAWGGDFIWVLPDEPDGMRYFEERAYEPIKAFTALIDSAYLKA